MKTFAPILAALCVALAIAGCGDETSSSADANDAKWRAKAAKRSEPVIRPLDGPPPKQLIVEDLIPGGGQEAQRGDNLAVHFASSRINGEPFESIWEEPFTFELSSKDVNPGWVRGLPGMRVGGRRELVVPTPLTSRFGIAPPQNDPKNALIYIVDLLAVR